MNPKMSFDDLKSLFNGTGALMLSPVYKSPDGLYVRTGKHAASKKLHRHVHNQSKKPNISKISPAQYRRNTKKNRK